MKKGSTWLAIIEHPKKSNRQRLYRYFEKMGTYFAPGTYHLKVSKNELLKITADIAKICDNSGTVRFIPICGACKKRSMQVSQKRNKREQSTAIIITG